ncbi:AAA family ATPase [Faecalimonas sp.]
MIKLKFVSLTLLGNRKNYSIHFKNGFNLISGPTSTGKTAILEMIDYALGLKGHKSYIEIGNSCSHVELVLYIGTEKYLIRRRLFEFKEPIIVEQWDNEKEKFLFHNRMEVDGPSNPKSLSAFLIEKMGLTDFSISGQAFSFRDVFKYCYIKQTEIDNEDILGEKSWEKNFKRKATFEILFNIYDKGLEQLKSSVEQKKMN